jgi:predicted RNA-binding Zn-ribbon protein involved in translation (DUF1610 family)
MNEISAIQDCCDACGTMLADGDRFCPRCGRPARRHCRSCGAEIVQTIAFYCAQCGERLDGRAAEADAART